MRRRHHYRATRISFLLASTVAFQTAAAEDESDVTRERAGAEVLFEAGRLAMDEGDYDTACQKFQASMELDPAPGTLMNLGNCEEKRGNVASAWERYVAAQRDLPDSDRRKEFAQAKAAELESKVPRLTLVLGEDAPESTEVRREEVVLTGSLGVPLPMDPGYYSIQVTAPGHAERSFDVALDIGEHRELEVYPGDPLPEADNSPPPQGAEGPVRFGPLTKRQWGYVVGGVGVAGLGTALTMGVLAYREKLTMEENCDLATRRCRDGSGLEAQESGDTFATVADVAGGIGLVALGAGVYLVLSSDSQSKEAAQPHFSGDGFAARLEWVTLPGGQGVQMKGTF
jgi:hypothetical protein